MPQKGREQAQHNHPKGERQGRHCFPRGHGRQADIKPGILNRIGTGGSHRKTAKESPVDQQQEVDGGKA